MENKVVVHMKSGTIYKGVTHDFDPARESFHLLPGEGGGVPVRLRIDDMKALFYVRDYVGNRHFVSRQDFQGVAGGGRQVVLTFRDGEEMWGLVENPEDEGAGFFLTPADKRDNNVRVFVVRSSLKDVRMVS